MSQASRHIDINKTLAALSRHGNFSLNRAAPLCVQRESLYDQCQLTGCTPVHRCSQHIIGVSDAAQILGLDAVEMHRRVLDAVQRGMLSFYEADNKFGVDAADLRSVLGLCGC